MPSKPISSNLPRRVQSPSASRVKSGRERSDRSVILPSRSSLRSLPIVLASLEGNLSFLSALILRASRNERFLVPAGPLVPRPLLHPSFPATSWSMTFRFSFLEPQAHVPLVSGNSGLRRGLRDQGSRIQAKPEAGLWPEHFVLAAFGWFIFQEIEKRSYFLNYCLANSLNNLEARNPKTCEKSLFVPIFAHENKSGAF